MSKYLYNVRSVGFYVHIPPLKVRVIRGATQTLSMLTLIAIGMTITGVTKWYFPLALFVLAFILRELMKRLNRRNERLSEAIEKMADLRNVRVHMGKFTGYDSSDEQVNGLIEYRGKNRTEIGIIQDTT